MNWCNCPLVSNGAGPLRLKTQSNLKQNQKSVTLNSTWNAGIAQIGRDGRRMKGNVQRLLHARRQVAHGWIDGEIGLKRFGIPRESLKKVSVMILADYTRLGCYCSLIKSNLNFKKASNT